ncbi:MAG: universal stress protein [Anaerolineales bacterium]|nr:universal stress protein [Anaerolineales bacterium]
MNQTTPKNKVALVCIGDKPLDRNAMEVSGAILNALDLHPILFHVLRPGSSSDEGAERLEKAQQMLGIEDAELLCIAGQPKSQILRELEQRNYQLLVLGTSERDANLAPSRMSQDLANQVSTSVLLLRNPPKQIERILICTAGHEESTKVISWGICLAQTINQQVTILHVASSPPTMYTGLDALEEDLSQVLSRESPLAKHLKSAASMAEGAGVKADLELRHGLVPEEILRACEVKPHDLVVLGAPEPRAILDRLLLGRIAPKLLSSTLCSTLIVRGELDTADN